MLSASALRTRAGELGFVLPPVVPPVANYAGAVFDGGILWVSGQLPFENGALPVTGLVGAHVSAETAASLARQSALHVAAQLVAFLEAEELEVEQCIRLGGFIAAAEGFTAHSTVMNGASDVIAALLDPYGKHARTTLGVASLPLGAPVEVEAQFLIG